MFKRLLWLFIGMGFGFGASFWAMRAMRQAAARLSPDRVAAELAAASRNLVDEARQSLKARLLEPGGLGSPLTGAGEVAGSGR